jgi:molybdopterin converting factor small subunit
MEIRLRLHWGLGRYLPHSPTKRIKLILPEKISIDELLEKHGIPEVEVGIVVVNGYLAGRDRTLSDQDDVHLYPPLEGG